MRLEVQAFPLPLRSNIDLEIPRALSFLGMDARGKAGVPKQLHVVALVDVESPKQVYKLRLVQEGLSIDDDKFSHTPIGHAVVEKPKVANYWLFHRTE